MNKIYLKIYTILPSFIQKFWKNAKKSDIGRRIATGIIWTLTGSIITQGLALLASIVVARILGKIEFGELGIIRSTVNMFVVFAGFGFGITATKYIAELRSIDKIKTSKIIGFTLLFVSGMSSIIAFGIIISAPLLSIKINAPHLVNEIRLGALILFFSALNGAQNGILAGFESFKIIAKVNLLAGSIALPLQIAFTLFLGLSGTIIGFGINYLILTILSHNAIGKVTKNFGVTIQFRKSWNEWSVLYKFSLPVLLTGTLVGPVMWICNAMMVNQPRGYSEMAIFDAANQWRNIILFIPAAVSQIILPLLSSSTTNPNQFYRILKVNVAINFFISLILALGLTLFAGIFMNAFGSNFTEGKTVLIILSFTAVMMSVNNVIGQAIIGKGEIWYGFLLNLFWSITLILFSIFFFKQEYGAQGLAYAFLISYLLHSINSFIFLKFRILKKKNYS